MADCYIEICVYDPPTFDRIRYSIRWATGVVMQYVYDRAAPAHERSFGLRFCPTYEVRDTLRLCLLDNGHDFGRNEPFIFEIAL